MGRVPRHRLGPGVFHVINRGINRSWILADDGDKRFFVDLLIRFAEDFSMNVYHWVVMANHFHLVLESLRVEDLSAFVGKLTRRFTLYHHARYGGSGPLWERRFRSRLVQKEGYLLRLGRYVERNPTRADVVSFPWEYPFSSAVAYSTGRTDGLVIPSSHPTWTNLSEADPQRRAAYKRYLMDDEGALRDEPEFAPARSVIGDESFSRNAHRVSGRRTARGRGRKHG